MKRPIVLLTALATVLAMAIPAVSAVPVHQVAGDRAPYIVLMDDDPVVAYEGDLAGLPATKPGKGNKVNPNSAAVKKYLAHLEDARN